MTMADFQNFVNHEIVVKLDGVDGIGNIVWHSASNTWHIIWKETGANPQQDLRITPLSDRLIAEIEGIGNNMFLVHPKPLK